MSNLDITFDNAYEYDYNDSKGSYHCIKNSDTGLRINSGNDNAAVAVFYEGNNPSAQSSYFCPLNGNLEGIDRSNSSVTAHFNCPGHLVQYLKNLVQNNDICDRSKCNNEMKGLHFKFK